MSQLECLLHHSTFRAALDLAGRGWPAGPVLIEQEPDGRFSKKPLTPHGYLDFTTEPEALAELFRAAPEANGVGIDLGRAGLVALDLDRLCQECCAPLYEALRELDAPIRRSARGAAVLFRRPEWLAASRWRRPCGHTEVLADGMLVIFGEAGNKAWRWEREPGTEVPVLPESLRTYVEPSGRFTAPREAAEPSGLDLPIGLDQGTRDFLLNKAGVEALGPIDDMTQSGAEFTALRRAAFAWRREGLAEDEMRQRIAELIQRAPGLWRTRKKGASPGWLHAEIERVLTKPGGSGDRPLDPAPSRVDTLWLSHVTPEEVRWLWYPVLPIGAITLLEGDPGLGKTWTALFIAATVSRGGPWPDGTHAAQGAVLYVSAEDDLANTIRPRLDLLGGDASRVASIRAVRDERGREVGLRLKDIEALREAIARVRPSLLVIDPVQAFIPDIDFHRANEVRPVLASLARLAGEARMAVLLIRHLSKAIQSPAIHRGLGSIDFTAAARSVLLVAPHPDDPELRVLAHVKSSLGQRAPSLTFRVSDRGLSWGSPSNLTADELLAAQALTARQEPGRPDYALLAAESFLALTLALDAKPSREIKEQAAMEGISERTLLRACRSLGVQVMKRGRETLWALPDE